MHSRTGTNTVMSGPLSKQPDGAGYINRLPQGANHVIMLLARTHTHTHARTHARTHALTQQDIRVVQSNAANAATLCDPE